MNEVEDSVASSFKENWPWMLIGLALLVFAWLLAPILTPFVVGAGLGYVGDPLVDRLERLRMSRAMGVGLVFLVIFSVLVLVILLVVPMLQGQLTVLIHNIPEWLTWVQDKALPKLGIRLPRGVQLDAEGLRTLITRNWSSASDILPALWERASQSTGAIITTVANLLLI